jgi:hypothetical protein
MHGVGHGTLIAASAIIKVRGVAGAGQGALEGTIATEEAGRTPGGEGAADKVAPGIVERCGVAVPRGLSHVIAAGAVERGLRGRGRDHKREQHCGEDRFHFQHSIGTRLIGGAAICCIQEPKQPAAQRFGAGLSVAAGAHHRPIRPRGTFDIMARLIGQWLTEKLGQPFVIENRPGAGGNIGTEAVVRAPADGYALLWSVRRTRSA